MNSNSENRKKGALGEKEAVRYLLQKGYKIRTTNYYAGHYEIDIIAECNNTLAFIEVKARKDAAFGLPEEYVSKKKLERLRKAAEMYLIHEKITDVPCQFDVITLLEEDGTWKVQQHYKNVLL